MRFLPSDGIRSPFNSSIVFLRCLFLFILQSTIINHEGGGADISSFSGKKAGDQKETFAKYRQDQE